ncbi:MAG: hypothetical protein RBQ90_07020 [Bacteroidales bacterium]|nr:hypothetical protein [Bacteroidales bacterium]
MSHPASALTRTAALAATLTAALTATEAVSPAKTASADRDAIHSATVT